MPEILTQLGEKYELVVISNSTREFLDRLLQTMASHFRAVFSTLSDFGKMKSPDLYLELCSVLGIAPSEMLHIGDSWPLDVDAAREAGVRTLYLERKEGTSGEGVVSDLSQIAEVLSSAE